MTRAGIFRTACALLLEAALLAAAFASAADQDTATRSVTLPGRGSASNDAKSDRPPKAVADFELSGSLSIGAQTADEREAERHYRTAILALKSQDVTIAADEMQEAARLAPENALVLYGLAIVQARNQHADIALPNAEKAQRLGLPAKEAAESEDLIASIRYAIRKSEAEQKRVTPAKLWGSYDVPLEEVSQETEDSPGKTLIKSRLPVSREMSLWKIDGESNIRGHWLEKDTLTEETSYTDLKRKDPKPKVTSQERWWLLSILINADGTLDGSRMERCARPAGGTCEPTDHERGKVVTFKGRVEPNGDLSILQDDAKDPITLKKKSRVTSLPPANVRIDTE